MVKIAVTGGIACGKSLVGSLLRRQGIPVCEADELAHQLMAPGEPLYVKVVASFGRDILDGAGAVDRSVLGERVFSDPAARMRLNSLVHPCVADAWRGWLQALAGGDGDRGMPAGDGHRAAAVIIPLLYEGRFEGEWDVVVCVSSSRALQLARLCERGFSVSQAEARIDAQMALGEKMSRADRVIVNNGSRALLEEQTDRVLRSILER